MFQIIAAASVGKIIFKNSFKKLNQKFYLIIRFQKHDQIIHIEKFGNKIRFKNSIQKFDPKISLKNSIKKIRFRKFDQIVRLKNSIQRLPSKIRIKNSKRNIRFKNSFQKFN